MNLRPLLIVPLVMSTVVMSACCWDRDHDSNTGSNTRRSSTANSATDADSTARNTASRNSSNRQSTDQSTINTDATISAEVRRSVRNDMSLSNNAHNCDISTDKWGVVTLRGPVLSQNEKDSVERKARSTAGVSSVVNELQVRQN